MFTYIYKSPKDKITTKFSTRIPVKIEGNQ